MPPDYHSAIEIANPIPEFIPKVHAELTMAFVQEKILSHLPSYLQEIAHHSIMSWRTPRPDCQLFIPTTESLREQIRPNFVDAAGKVDEDKKKQFFDRFSQGFMYSSDGIKLSSVSQKDEKLGDAYIIGNLEVLLRAAKELDCDFYFGVYSGDETASFFIPRSLDQALTGEMIEQAIQKASETYYRQDQSSSPFFSEVQKIQTANLSEKDKDLRLGLQGKAMNIEKAYLRRKPHKTNAANEPPENYRDRALIAAIIDATESDEGVPDYIASIGDSNTIQPLIHAAEHTYQGERTVAAADHPRHENHGKTMTKWPQAVKDMYNRALALIDPPDEVKARQVQAFAELAVYEPLYSGDLEIRKIQWFENDIAESIAHNIPIHIARFADTRLKSVNKESHLFGDYNLIATTRIIQNRLKDAGIDPHHKIKYYQHYGSFMMTVEGDDPELWNKISIVIGDPQNINLDSLARDISYKRFSPGNQNFRAIPLIVPTIKLHNPNFPTPMEIVINEENLPDLWKTVDHLKYQQVINEIGFTYKIASIAGAIPTLLQIVSREGYPMDPEIVDACIHFVTNILSKVYKEYTDARPERDAFRNVYDSFN